MNCMCSLTGFRHHRVGRVGHTHWFQNDSWKMYWLVTFVGFRNAMGQWLVWTYMSVLAWGQENATTTNTYQLQLREVRFTITYTHRFYLGNRRTPQPFMFSHPSQGVKKRCNCLMLSGHNNVTTICSHASIKAMRECHRRAHQTVLADCVNYATMMSTSTSVSGEHLK